MKFFYLVQKNCKYDKKFINKSCKAYFFKENYQISFSYVISVTWNNFFSESGMWQVGKIFISIKWYGRHP